MSSICEIVSHCLMWLYDVRVCVRTFEWACCYLLSHRHHHWRRGCWYWCRRRCHQCDSRACWTKLILTKLKIIPGPTFLSLWLLSTHSRQLHTASGEAMLQKLNKYTVRNEHYTCTHISIRMCEFFHREFYFSIISMVSISISSLLPKNEKTTEKIGNNFVNWAAENWCKNYFWVLNSQSMTRCWLKFHAREKEPLNYFNWTMCARVCCRFSLLEINEYPLWKRIVWIWSFHFTRNKK